MGYELASEKKIFQKASFSWGLVVRGLDAHSCLLEVGADPIHLGFSCGPPPHPKLPGVSLWACGVGDWNLVLARP